nr:MAG TPA: hypothetical protein [Caudoviricetes sp.]
MTIIDSGRNSKHFLFFLSLADNYIIQQNKKQHTRKTKHKKLTIKR